MNGPPSAGSAPSAAPASPLGAATFHPCPHCGHGHWPPPPAEAECMCGHRHSSHDDNGGRRKRMPCTVWDPIECPCEDYHQ